MLSADIIRAHQLIPLGAWDNAWDKAEAVTWAEGNEGGVYVYVDVDASRAVRMGRYGKTIQESA